MQQCKLLTLIYSWQQNSPTPCDTAKQHSRMQGISTNADNSESQKYKQKQKLTHTTQIIQQKTR